MTAALAEVEAPATPTPTKTDLSGAVFAARRGRGAGRQWQVHAYDTGKGWAMHSVVDGEEHWTHRKTDELLDEKRWRVVPVEQVDLELLNSGTGFQMPRIAAKPRRRMTGPKRKRDELVGKRIDGHKELLEVFEAAKHPTRLRVLLYAKHCGRKRFSSVEIATDLPDATLGTVAYHVRVLKRLKLIKPAGTTMRRGAIEHFYELTPKGEKVVTHVEAIVGG